jgi:hypothetical protein
MAGGGLDSGREPRRLDGTGAVRWDGGAGAARWDLVGAGSVQRRGHTASGWWQRA